MPQRALLRIAPSGRLEWLDPERPQAGLQASTPPPGRDIILLLPAEDVLLTRAPRVAKGERLLRQALPFAIEERLAAPVEQLHVAFSGSGDPVDVAVVARERLQAALDALSAHGLQASAVYSEASLLPQPGRPLLLLDGERVLLRTGAGSVLVEPIAGLPALIELLQGAAEPLDDYTVLSCEGSPAELLPAPLAARAAPAPRLLAQLATQLSTPAGPNLLQGEFAPRLQGDALPWLKRAAVLAALGVGLAFTHGLVERQQLKTRIDAQRAQMGELLKQAIPGTTAVVDPRAQLEIEYTRLARGAGGDDALELLARVAPSLAGSSRYRLESIDYRAGALDLTLRAPDVATLDGLRETFAALGLSAELTSATPGQDAVEGRISLRAAGRPGAGA
jgi:general secretion pathway protein L